MEIVTEDYSIKYDAETITIHWEGVMRLNGKEYDPISELFNEIGKSNAASVLISSVPITIVFWERTGFIKQNKKPINK